MAEVFDLRSQLEESRKKLLNVDENIKKITGRSPNNDSRGNRFLIKCLMFFVI